MQRNFEPMRRHVEGGRQIQLTDDRAKLVIYRAFVEAELDAPKDLVRDVHDAYLRVIAGFEARTTQANPALKPWSESAPITLCSRHKLLTTMKLRLRAQSV
jgi:hypothetical protein